MMPIGYDYKNRLELNTRPGLQHQFQVQLDKVLPGYTATALIYEKQLLATGTGNDGRLIWQFLPVGYSQSEESITLGTPNCSVSW